MPPPVGHGCLADDARKLEHCHARKGRRIMRSDANPHVAPPSLANSQYTFTPLAVAGGNDAIFMYSRNVQNQIPMEGQTLSSSLLPESTSWRADDMAWALNFNSNLCFALRLSPGDGGIVVHPIFIMGPGQSPPQILQGREERKHMRRNRLAAILISASGFSSLASDRIPRWKMVVNSFPLSNNGRSNASGPVWVTRTFWKSFGLGRLNNSVPSLCKALRIPLLRLDVISHAMTDYTAQATAQTRLSATTIAYNKSHRSSAFLTKFTSRWLLSRPRLWDLGSRVECQIS